MVMGGPYVSDGEPQAVPALEHGVREQDLARGVDALEDGPVGVITALVAEADSGERGRSHALEARIPVDLGGQLLGPADVSADDFGDALAAVITQDKPQLQRAEAVAQRNSV